jgi:hypothetical protein
VIIAMGQNCVLESSPGGDDVEFWNYCLLVSIANCFWWIDSKYENPNGFPGDGEDIFPLVEDYGAGDDHAFDNVPLLICELSNWDGTACFNYTLNIEEAAEEWCNSKGLEGMFDVVLYEYPTFELLASEIEQGKPVIFQVLFYNVVGGNWESHGNHFVSCAGVNSDENLISICDPFLDINNPIESNHNDAQNVSYDIYFVENGTPSSEFPDINMWLPDYWPYYDYCLIDGMGVINTINEPPYVPSIIGETNGKTGTEYDYSFSSVDPDDDNVQFFIDWGDNDELSEYIGSGEDLIISHKWNSEENYTIRAKAIDINGFESDWVNLDVSIPKSKQFNIINLWLSRLIQQFSILENLLN